MWLKIELDLVGDVVRVSAESSLQQRIAARPLGIPAPEALQLAEDLRLAAMGFQPLSGELLARAKALSRAVLDGGIDGVRASLAASGKPFLVRFDILSAALQGIPWEALGAPDEASGFWASSPTLLPVRRVFSSEPYLPRRVRGAVRVLVVAPSGDTGVLSLKTALKEQIEAGQVEWLEPITGPLARVPKTFDKLQKGMEPHVLHFIGHGSLQDEVPNLLFADTFGDDLWLPAEGLAQELKARFGDTLRLIVLECCEGAKPSERKGLASAAETMARAGADAVIGHLWEIRSDVARACSVRLYRSLASGGDVAVALNDARRELLLQYQGSAEAFSPVVYLRGEESVLFDFDGRKLAPPGPARLASETQLPGPLAALFKQPFSLLLGDHLAEARPRLDGFRGALEKTLQTAAAPAPANLPMSALAQRYAFHVGTSSLHLVFQKAFRKDEPIPPYIDALARFVGPGVHVTLLRNPWLERAIADKQPQRTIHVLQLGGDEVLVARREAGDAEWSWPIPLSSVAIEPEKDIVLLRLYGGYTPQEDFAAPLLTEDEHFFQSRNLENVVSSDLASILLSSLRSGPVLLVGMSLYTSHHRMLLQQLFLKGMKEGSVAVVEPGAAEHDLWRKGRGVPINDKQLNVAELTSEDLAALLGGGKAP